LVYVLFLFVSAEQGEAYVFYGGKDFPTGKATKECSFFEPVEPCPAKKVSGGACAVCEYISVHLYFYVRGERIYLFGGIFYMHFFKNILLQESAK